MKSALLLLLFASVASAQNYQVSQTKVFPQQHKKVLLLTDTRRQQKVILFQTTLRVNSDGSALSYHPQDLRGTTRALNTICNGIAVRKGTSSKNLCLDRATYSEAISVFERYRDSNFQTVPAGYRINWQNVLSGVKENGLMVPCIFKSGPFKGYFGSLTALKNGLTANKGDCDFNDQLDPIAVPALVLVGGQNVVNGFGASVGDLLVAYNPATRLFSSAVIGDTGPEDNLGEGSISLNMKLLGTTVPPTNKAETYRLSIENAEVLIAIIPASRMFQAVKPFTAESINQRVSNWQTQAGFRTPEEFVECMKSFQTSLL